MEMFFELFEWIVFLALLATGYTVGRILEKRHYASIRRRETELAPILVFGSRFPPDLTAEQHCELVTGCVVISSDYFKKFVFGLGSLIGGRSRGYETLLDRGRREAMLRMKASARRKRYTTVVNVKYESTAIVGNRGGVPAFEILVFGTALKPADAP